MIIFNFYFETFFCVLSLPNIFTVKVFSMQSDYHPLLAVKWFLPSSFILSMKLGYELGQQMNLLRMNHNSSTCWKIFFSFLDLNLQMSAACLSSCFEKVTRTTFRLLLPSIVSLIYLFAFFFAQQSLIDLLYAGHGNKHNLSAEIFCFGYGL